MALSPITTHWFTSEFARLERAGSNINSNLLNWAQFKIAQKHLKLVFFAHLKCPARTSKEVTTVWLDEQINNYTTKTPMIWRRHTQNRGLWLVLVLAICYLTLRVSRVFFLFFACTILRASALQCCRLASLAFSLNKLLLLLFLLLLAFVNINNYYYCNSYHFNVVDRALQRWFKL